VEVGAGDNKRLARVPHEPERINPIHEGLQTERLRPAFISMAKLDVGMSQISRTSLIVDCIRAAAKTASINKITLLLAVRTVLDDVPKPGSKKLDQKRWMDECVKRLAKIYIDYTGRKIGFTNCEAETRFERFVRLVAISDDQEISRNLLKAAIRRFNEEQAQDIGSAIEFAAE
jgi:hypothetical protein